MWPFDKKELTPNEFLKLLKSGKTLPDNLSVGGSLDLRGSNVANIVWMATECGWSNRKGAVFFNKGEPQIQLGCFRGNEKEALSAIGKKYGKDDEYYITVKNAFDEFNEKFSRK